jgi:hypothetical protein
MLSVRHLLCAVLTVGVLLSAPSAEARFGKRSTSSQSSEKKTHDASAVGDDDDDDDDDKPRRRSSSSSGLFLVDLLFSLFLETRVGIYVPPPQPTPPSEMISTNAPPVDPTRIKLGVDGAALNTVAGLSAFLTVEGKRVGVDGRATGLLFPTDDATAAENINLTNLHLTVALLADEDARLRVEGGISSAHAPDLTAVGPSFALSFDATLAGSLDLELRAQGTPFPYRQLDAQAGLAVHLNYLVLRGGWRSVYLNDNGLVDDEVHEDAFGGPYIGLGFCF